MNNLSSLPLSKIRASALLLVRRSAAAGRPRGRPLRHRSEQTTKNMSLKPPERSNGHNGERCSSSSSSFTCSSNLHYAITSSPFFISSRTMRHSDSEFHAAAEKTEAQAPQSPTTTPSPPPSWTNNQHSNSPSPYPRPNPPTSPTESHPTSAKQPSCTA